MIGKNSPTPPLFPLATSSSHVRKWEFVLVISRQSSVVKGEICLECSLYLSLNFVESIISLCYSF